MKTLKLKVVHRLLLQGLLNDAGKQGTTLTELNKMLKIVDRLVMDEAYVKSVNLRLVNKDDAGNDLPAPQYKWNTKDENGNEVDVEKEVELSDEQGNLLHEIFKSKNEKKEFKLDDAKQMMELASQVGFSFE